MLPISRLSFAVQKDCGLAPIEIDAPQHAEDERTIDERVVDANRTDEVCNRIRQGLTDGSSTVDGIRLHLCTIDD